jgi:hypothetical protein
VGRKRVRDMTRLLQALAPSPNAKSIMYMASKAWSLLSNFLSFTSLISQADKRLRPDCGGVLVKIRLVETT